MATQLQLRRGTTSENASFTGAVGEVTVDTTKDTLIVQDGSTAGGHELAKADGTNISFGDNVKATFGAGDDLQIYHDGSNSYVKDAGTGTLNLQGSTQVLIAGANGTVGVQFVEGGGVNLRHNNSPKLSTTSTGIDVTGTATMDGLQVTNTATTGTNQEVASFRTASGGGLVIKASDLSSANPDSILEPFFGESLKIKTSGNDRFKIKDNGDISFYEDTGTTPKMVWSASAESLGIGTSAPNALLEINKASEGEYLRVGGDSASNARSLRFTSSTSSTGSNGALHTITANSASGEIAFANGDGTIMYLKDGGNVGIGTNAPSAPLSVMAETVASVPVAGASSSHFAVGKNEQYGTMIGSLGSGIGYIQQQRFDGNATTYDLALQPNGGNVGIGTDSPVQLLHLKSAAPAIEFDASAFATVRGRISSDEGNLVLEADYQNSRGNSNIAFKVDNAERMRIDSAGNLLVGGTSPYAVDATTITQTGLVYSSRTSNLSGQFDRRTTNGEIMRFTKDGAPVGSIGTGGGDIVVASRSNKGFKIYAPNADGTGAILHPSTDAAGNPLNAKMDLGYSSGRFKDLYLSGGVYLGGTAAANKLDEYEEGIWIPTLTTSNGGTLGLQYAKGRYTKVGNLVHVSVNIRRDATALSGTDGFLQISTPFTSASSESSHRAGASCVYQTVTLNGILVARMQANNAYFNLQKETNGVLNTSITAADLSNGAPASSSGYVQVAFSYLSV